MENKKAKNEDEAWEMQEMYKGSPRGWIQWKGTDVCMDIHCKCGYHSHVDADFAYFVKCPKCGTVYMCNGHIELIEVEQEPENGVVLPEIEECYNSIWHLVGEEDIAGRIGTGLCY